MNSTHTVMVLMALTLAVMLSALIAVIAFAVARWGGAPVPVSVIAGGRAFATTLTVCSAVAAVVLTIVR
ncbi:hypothetical protein [Streptomyces sp. NPDC048256]|uniref:hypothetical protein n=1 Tax=Streptomyces sp. NPDC048256 TaxID=3154613 RepID=UPI0033C60683